MHYKNSLKAKKHFFLLKKIIHCGDGDEVGIPKPVGTGMKFNSSSPFDMGRVMSIYMRVGDGDGEGKTRPHPGSMSCLD